jgi:hypothetical protein
MPSQKQSNEGSERKDKEQSGSGGGEDQDLKSREYRDEQGEVHHHTKKYMEQHGGEEKQTSEEEDVGDVGKGED